MRFAFVSHYLVISPQIYRYLMRAPNQTILQGYDDIEDEVFWIYIHRYAPNAAPEADEISKMGNAFGSNKKLQSRGNRKKKLEQVQKSSSLLILKKLLRMSLRNKIRSTSVQLSITKSGSRNKSCVIATQVL
jgi:hypothetical protein